MTADDPYARGVARAASAMAEAQPAPPIDAGWCSFRAGLECVNGASCANPNHRRPDDPDD